MIVKPIIDTFCALLLLALLFPFMLLITILLGVHFLGVPFFIQERVGYKEHTFHLLKFRTYKKEGDPDSVTRLGKMLRRFSIDELPQLINILSGEMSFIGPRPLLKDYLPHYTQKERMRHLVKPGLSGWSQVAVGNTNDWDKRLQYDHEYIKRQSLGFDSKILIKTIQYLFKRKRRGVEEVIRFDVFAKER